MTADAVVVGSGAGGGIVAKELAAAGWRVALLERGPWLKTFGHLETRDSWTTGIDPVPFGPAPSEIRTVRAGDREKARVAKPRTGRYGTLPFMVGGGSVFYGAMAWRFHPESFRLRSLLGPVPGANLEDWPVTYEELEPFYEKAEYELGVSGDENPHGPPRRKPLPLPPLPDNREAEVLFQAARRLGWKPFHTPLAILSQPYRGRAACVRCAYCNGFGCEAGAKSSTLASVIPEALRTGHCRLIPGAFASEITVNGSGRPDGVVYQKAGSRKRQRIAARVIVVCASATETPRLLLNSRSKFFPTGIGNERDQVGRNLDNDGGMFAYGLFERDVTDMNGPGVCFAVDGFQFRETGAGRLGGILSNYHTRPPLGFVRRIQAPESAAYGRGLKEFYRANFLRSIWIYATCHTLPRAQNRVDVDPEVRDGHGTPVSRITYRQHARNAEQEQFMADRCGTLLHEAGARTVVKPRVVKESESGISTHQLGSCRMGNDPASSVTDRFGRIHGVSNLYIADGSLLVNPGGVNPSLTIQALAYWVSAGILREH